MWHGPTPAPYGGHPQPPDINGVAERRYQADQKLLEEFAKKRRESGPRHDPIAPAPAEGYPDGNPKTALGRAKPSLRFIPPVALYVMGQAMEDGGVKYGHVNWRLHPVSSSVYYDAAMRHLMAWWDGEDTAADSGVDHMGHVMACVAILVDAKASGKLNDDRGHPGPLPAFLKANTKGAV